MHASSPALCCICCGTLISSEQQQQLETSGNTDKNNQEMLLQPGFTSIALQALFPVDNTGSISSTCLSAMSAGSLS
jgi:hypothetical protein